MLVDGAHPNRWVDPSASMQLADIGNFDIALGDIPKSLELIEKQAKSISHLAALGGEHTITLALLRALAKKRGPIGLVHFDAHVDTWKENFGQKYGHGSVFFHTIEEGLVDPRRTIQIFSSTAARRCKRLIVEVNRNMPRVFGQSQIHVSELAAIVENNVPLIKAGAADRRPRASRSVP